MQAMRPSRPSKAQSTQQEPARRVGFVELDRKFSPVRAAGERENAADDSYLVGSLWGQDLLDWGKLLERPLVVLLGEPGSGKSWEIEHQAQKLVAAGQFAFFLRLECLIAQSVPEVCGTSAGAFAEWSAGIEPATFFLDSVDESKLNGVEGFYFALRRFRAALPAGFRSRAKIVLSSRISEWHPETDGARVREYFDTESGLVRTTVDDGEELTRIRRGDEGLLVVQIMPLDRQQVETLVTAIGMSRSGEFLDALDRSHAWEFARRPLDVRALVEFWRKEGRIGSLTELIEFELQRNLCERRAHAHDPLTDEDARAGAEALAAGVVFCGTASIKVPDEGLIGHGLDGRICVPEHFTRDQFEALLTRPIFDGESHGHVRFHHRRVREYLAASWVTRRMNSGCSTEELEGLFFDHIGGRRILRASRGSVVAWLCAGGEYFNVIVRKWVLESAPGLNLRFGDPHVLPLDYKRSILTRLKQEATAHSRIWLETDQDALSRLAAPELVPDIEAIIRDRSLASDLRSAMLETVRHGRLTNCLSTVLAVIADPLESEELKVYAVATLRDLGDFGSHTQLAGIARGLQHVSTALTDILVGTLFPERLSVDEFVGLLRKTREPNGRTPDIRWRISGCLKERLQLGQASSLLNYLLELMRSEPVLASEPGAPAVSREYHWLRPLLMIPLSCLLQQDSLTKDEVRAVAAGLSVVGSLRRELEVSEEEAKNLGELAPRHPSVRREFFWAAVARKRCLGQDAIDHPFMIFSHHDGLLAPSFSDTDWLIEDLAAPRDAADREVALRHAMHWFNRSGRPWLLRRRINRAIRGSNHLLDISRKLDRSGLTLRVQRFSYQLQQEYWTRKHQLRLVWHGRIMKAYYWARSWLYLRQNLKRIASGDLPLVVHQLVTQADSDSRDRLTIKPWKALARKWGDPVEAATRKACKAFWRTYCPDLAHEAGDPAVIPYELTVGLTGLNAAWDDNDLNIERLSDEDVKLATRYAMREVNGFPPWLPQLAAKRPDAVGAVFAESVIGEWSSRENRHVPREGIQRLAWSGGPLLPRLQSTILDRLRSGDPDPQVLGHTLSILLSGSAPPLEELQAIAQARILESTTPAASVAQWFALWLQIQPDTALAAWSEHIQVREDASQVMLLTCAGFHDRGYRIRVLLTEPRHLRVAILRRLIPLVYSHIRPEDDINRAGSYTPEARDDAQEFRNALFRCLAESPDPAAAEALRELSQLPEFVRFRDILLHFREENLQRCADHERWQPDDIRQFEQNHEVNPRTDRDLFRIVLRRFKDIKANVEQSDLGLRTHLRQGDLESALRIWISQEMIRSSRQRYTVPQEAVIDQSQRPDIRLENPRTDAVSVEVKWAQRWSFNDLWRALEDQLLGQYLRAHKSRHGILLLGLIEGGRRNWEGPDGRLVDFPELIKLLQARANQLEEQQPEVKRLEVVGVDFRNPNATQSSSQSDSATTETAMR